ncbi:MAG: hypothetical protein JEY99_04970 [Spirochaetales bacterium]|nr:hypothetical protein [Spirochaetales bacterium]
MNISERLGFFTHKIILILIIFLLSTCDLLQVGLGESVDVVPPEVAITTPGNDPMEYKNEDFTFTGTVTDDIEVADVTISWSGVTLSADIDGSDWSATIPFEDITERGQVLFEVTAADTAGKTTNPVSRTVAIDDIPPTVIVTAPSIFNPGPENSNYIVVEGEAWDDSPIVSVTVEIYDPANLSTPLISQAADGDRTWSTRIVISAENGFVNSNNYLYNILIEDKAGNINTHLYHSSDFWTYLPAGELFPSTNDIGLWDQYGQDIDITDEGENEIFTAAIKEEMKISTSPMALELDFSYNSDKDKPVISLSSLDPDKSIAENTIGQNVPIYASATDDKEGIQPNSVFLNITQDNSTNPEKEDVNLTIAASDFNAPGDGLYTSFQFKLSDENFLEPGQYNGKITAEDKKGTTSTLNFAFLVDKGAPGILSLSPSSTYAGLNSNGDIEITVQVKDDNPGTIVLAEASETDGTPLTGLTSVIQGTETAVNDGDDTSYHVTYLISIPGPVPDEVEVEVTVEDSSLLRNTRSVEYTIDRDDPELFITVPGTDDVISGNAFTATGTASDSSSNVYQVVLSLYEGILTETPADITWEAAEGNTTWSLPFDLTTYNEGDFTLFAKAIDVAGNEGDVEQISFYYDLSDPELTIVQGTGKEYMTATFELSGTIADSNEIDELNIRVARDGGTFSNAAGYPRAINAESDNWTYSMTVDPDGDDDGIYEFEFILSDIAEKTKTLTKTIVVDTTPPELVVSNLADGDSVNSSTYIIQGLASDLSGIASTEYLQNQDPATALDSAWADLVVERTGNWELEVSGLVEGDENTITFRTTDVVGWEEELATIHFALDLYAPSMTITDKATYNGTWQNGTLTLNGTAQDISGIDHMEISTDGGVIWNNISGAASVDNTLVNWTSDIVIPADGSEDGSHVVRIKAIDNYNKETIDSLTIKYDSSGPVVTPSNIVDDFIIPTATFNIRGTGTDNGGSGLSTVEYSFDYSDDANDSNDTWTTLTGTTNWNGNVVFNLGLNQDIHFRGTDAKDNTGEVVTINVDADFASPETTVNWTDLLYKSVLFNIAGTASDDLGVANVTIEATGANSGTAGIDPGFTLAGSLGDVSRAWDVDAQPTTDGTYTYVITVTDLVGNTSIITRNVFYDTTPPVLDVTNLSDGDFVETSGFTIRGTAIDDAGIKLVEYNLNGDGWDTATGTISWSQAVSGLSEGAGNSIQFRVKDNSDLITTLPAISFGLDLSNPTLSITNKDTYNDTWQNSAFTLNGTSTDANGIASIQISTDGGATYSTSGVSYTAPDWTADVTIPSDGSAEGNHVIRVKAIDTYNKEAIEFLTVKYDTTPPTFSLTNIVDDQLITNLSFVASGSWSDNGGSGTDSGLADVQYRIGSGSWTSFSDAGSISSSTFSSTFSTLTQAIDETISFRAYDVLGNLSAETILTGIDADYSLPEIEEETLNTTARVLENNILSMSGTASDTLGLKSVVITAVKDSVDQGEVYNEVTDLENWGPYTLGPGNDGVWIFTITATDLANRPFSVIREVEMDSTPPTATITSVPAADVNDGASFLFEGNAADTGGSGVEAVRISFAPDGTGAQLAAGKTTWSATVDLAAALGSEGLKNIYVQVEDKAGNFSLWENAEHNDNHMEAFIYDTAIPVTVLTSATNRDVKAGFSITGTASDNFGIASVAISQRKDGGLDIPVLTNGPTGTDSWTLTNLPRDPDNIGVQDLSAGADGEYVYTIITTDNANKNSIETVSTVRLDQTAPDTLEVSSPGAGQTGLNALSGDAFTFRGTSGDVGVGMEKIYYLIDQTALASSTLGNYTELATSGNWSFTDDFDTDGSGTDDSGRAEGTWYIHVLAEDASGNRTDFGSAVTVEFDIDQAPPVITENDSLISGSSTVYKNTDIDFGGDVSDANGIASVVVSYIKNDTGSPNVLLNDTTGNPTWSTTLETALDDGTYEVTITAFDEVGKTTSIIRNIVIDTVDPEAEITSLTPVIDTHTVNGKITIRAAIADGIALDYVQWALLPAAETPVDGNYTTITGSKTSPVFAIDTTATTSNFAVNADTYDVDLTTDQGLGVDYKLWLRTYDRAGNIRVITQDLDVDQDSDLPVISFTGIDTTAVTAEDSYKNLIESNAVLRFVITDDDLVDVSTIQISVGDNTSWESINRNGGDALVDGVNISTNHNLSLPTVIDEGTTLFYLRASDELSAKDGVAVDTRTAGPIYLMVDRNFPVLTEETLVDDSVFKSAIYQLDGNLSDTNALSNITITEKKDSDAAVEVLNTDLSGLSATWTLPDMPQGGVADGNYLYTITATDASAKQTILTRTVIIDSTPPELPLVTTPTADTWLNSGTYIFSGTAADGNSGINTVYFTETLRGGVAPAKGNAAWLAASVDGDGNWRASVVIAAEGERTLHLYSIDRAGNDSAITTHNFGFDQAAPVISVTGGSGTQYENGNFTIGGTFTDGSGISAIAVETSSDNTNFSPADPATAAFDNDAHTWTWNRTVGSQAEGTYFYRFQFTDQAGNTSQTTQTINYDKQAPVIGFSGTIPSINFDGGAKTATGNGVMTLSGTILEDQLVANISNVQYQIATNGWVILPISDSFTIGPITTTDFTDSSDLDVAIQVTDRNGNEGNETFTISIDQSSDIPDVTITAPTQNQNISSTNTTVIGTITDDDGISGDSGSAQYRYYNGTSWGLWTDFNVTGAITDRSFSFTVNGVSDGNKSIQIMVTDVNGTTLAAAEEVGFNFDTDEPDFIGLSPAAGSYQTADFSITGTVQDDTLVKSLQYRVERNGSQIIAPTTIFDFNGTASKTFSQNIDTSFGTGEYEIFLTASDGTFTRNSSVSIYVDKTLPEASFDPETSADTQNNIITISGETSDNYRVQSITFKIVDVNNGNAEMDLPTGSLIGTDYWEITDFDTRNTSLLSYANDLGSGLYEFTLRAIVTDDAGNIWNSGVDYGSGVHDLIFQADQTLDNPEITINNIDTDGSSTITTTTITGNVIDDDGISTILVDTWDKDNSTAAPSRSETVVLTSGSYGQTDIDWRVVLNNNGNGVRSIRVRTIDTDDNNGQDYSATDYSRTDTGKIDFKLDTEIPEVSYSTPADNITWSANNSFTFTGTSDDETSITSLKYKIDNNDFSTGATTISGDTANWSFTIDQSSLGDGSHTIYVLATDSVNNTNLTAKQINIDKTAPTISVTTPVNNATVFGPLTIGGTTIDNTGGAGVESVKIGLGRQIDPTSPATLEASTWVEVAGTTSWSHTFTNINNYANESSSVNQGDTDGDGVEDAGETWGDIWDFTFYVRTIDSAGEGVAGNISYLTSYTLQIDPKKDRPEVSVLSPEDGNTVGGFVRVFGTATDGQYIEKVQIAIDISNDGTYDTWDEGTLDEIDDMGTPVNTSDDVYWYLVNGTDSWNISLNENNEFNPSGVGETQDVGFKVRAKDYKVTPGDGVYSDYSEDTKQVITFNKAFPQFDGMNLESGATVGDTVILTGIVHDESNIARIIYSNEGPLLDNTIIFNLNDWDTKDSGAANYLNLNQTTNQEVGKIETDTGSGLYMTVDFLGEEDTYFDYLEDENGDPITNPGRELFPGYYYRVNIPIDTEATGLYPNGAGSMSVRLTAEDTTSGTPYTNQYPLSFDVDNKVPTELTYTGDTEIMGTSASIKGTVKDEGFISGIDRIVVYLTNINGEIIPLQDDDEDSGNTYPSPIAGFSEADVLDEGNTVYTAYRMVIDNTLEDGNDNGSAGDDDGIPEYLSLSSGTYNWEGQIDSSLIDDGSVTIHYIAQDDAGNYYDSDAGTAGSQPATLSAFIANNKPEISSLTIGTNLNGDVDGSLDPIIGESEKSDFSSYGTIGYTAVNDALLIKANTIADTGNGTLRYSIKRITGGTGTELDPYVYSATEFNSSTNLLNPEVVIDTSNATNFPDGDSNYTFGIQVFDSTNAASDNPDENLSQTVIITVTIDNEDEIDPVIYSAPLGQQYSAHTGEWDHTAAPGGNGEPPAVEDYEDNIAMSGDATPLRLGHVEYATQTQYDNGIQNPGDSGNDTTDDDADISGTIIFRGRVEDNQQIGRIQATIPGYNGGTAFDIYTQAGGALADPGADWAFAIDTDTYYISQDNGEGFNWSFQWNSARLADVVADNVNITFTVSDKASTPRTAADSIIVDVVPYITDVQTVFENGTLQYLKRSARGTYSIGTSDINTDLIRITGFNLDPDGTGTNEVYVGTETLTIDDWDTTDFLWVDTRKDSTVSGVLSIITNGTRSINSTNNDALDQNQEPSDFAPHLTDDRYLAFWDTDTTAYTSKTEAVMVPNSGRTDMSWMYVENGQRVYLNGTQLTNSWSIKGGNFAYNDDGTPMWIYLHNMNWSSGQTAWQYYGSVQWGKDQAYEAAAYNWQNTSTDRLGLGNLSFINDNNYSSYSEVVMNRYINLQMEVDGGDTGTTNYVAYFDQASESRSIVFWSFQTGTGVTNTTRLARDGTNTRWWSDLEKFSDDTNDYGSTGYDVGIRTPNAGIARTEVTTGGADSQYFDMAWDDVNGNAYIAYYDEQNGELKLAYNTDPGNSPGAWTTRTTAIDTGAGQYVAMDVDPAGGIHLSYFDGTNSNLKYAYLSSYDVADAEISVSTVDALFTNGMYNDIVIKDFDDTAGTDYRPTISSYSLSYGGTKYSLRVAYPVAAKGTYVDTNTPEEWAYENGADPSSGNYTGNWEVLTVISTTAPGQNPSFIETDSTTALAGQIIVGYNGSTIEEAILLDETP